LGATFDLEELERVIERAIRKARSEELKIIAEAVKTLADYMKTGFKETIERIEAIEKRIETIEKRMEIIEKRLEEHAIILQEHTKRLEELTRTVSRLEVALGSIGRRWGRDLEKMVLEIYRHALEERGVLPEKVERFIHIDRDGKYYVKDSRIEFDIYVHDDKVYLIEVKSHAELEHVEWFYKRGEIYEKITGRKPSKLILLAVHIDEDAYARAKELGIDVIYGAIIP
jgi:hypothetical protein